MSFFFATFAVSKLQDMFEHLKIEERGTVAIMTISAPKSLNALNTTILKEMDDYLTHFDCNKYRVLIVTGDPIPTASRDEVKSVYNFNSRKLIQYVSSLNRSVLPRPFRIFGALNLNARNFSIQLEMAKKKETNGADGFLTQPILTEQAFET